MGLRHSYGKCDCITLVLEYYKQFGVIIDIPDYPTNRKWASAFSTTFITSTIEKHAKKVDLTAMQNNDLIVFAANNIVNHFAVYIDSLKMLHIEENSVSKLDRLDDYWMKKIYGVYRLNALV